MASFLALLWFSYRALRFSLTHAFFLVVFATFTASGVVQGFQSTGGIVGIFAPVLVGGAIGLSVMLLKVWLLGNFEVRGAGFRRNAIIGLVAATIAAGYVSVLIGEVLGYGEGEFSAISPVLDVVAGVFGFYTATVFELGAIFGVLVLVYLLRMFRHPADATPTGRTVR